MADVRPFRGILYSSHKDPSSVLAPPYDVIDESGQKELAARDEQNCVRLILPEGEGEARYPSAAALFDKWQEDGTLFRSERPSLYRYHQVFEHPQEPGRTITRRGVIAAVRLHRFDEKVILPHERTLKGPKIDRLNLMSASSAHFSQIFTLYSDPSRESDRVFESVEGKAPTIEGRTDDGTLHRVWEVSDAEVIGSYQKLMAPHKLYIADGHHRYETMLALRDKMSEAAGGTLPADSDAQFGTLFLSNMDDSGMIVLPTHRLIHSLKSFDGAALVSSLGEHFEVTEIASREPAEIRKAVESAPRPAVALVLPAAPAQLVVLRESFDVEKRLGTVVGRLDVAVLHDLILEDLLGIDRAAQEAKTNIKYVKDDSQAVDRLDKGEGQLCFLMRATPLEHVKMVSDAGKFMPQKLTFFVPKIASGVVFRKVDPSAPC